jgi:hypothetical protein
MTIEPLKSTAAFALAALLLVLAGCTDKANLDNVDRRSVERWNYLIAHQAEKAYDDLTPGFRATQSRDAYASAMNTRPVQWKSVKFNGKKCDADRCKVQLDVTYSINLPGLGKPTEATSSQNETWILVKGEWYFLPSA